MVRDNRGMSLVELILALTMATVVMGAATLFLRTALNTYNLADAHVDVQKEAQLNLEQIGTWIMEGNRVAVTGNGLTSGNSILVVFDEPVSGNNAALCKNLINYTSLSVGGDAKYDASDNETHVKVFWLGEDNKLYMLYMYTQLDYPTYRIHGGEGGAFDVLNFGSSDSNAIAFMKEASSYTYDKLKAYENEDRVISEYATDFDVVPVKILDANNRMTGLSLDVRLEFEEETVKYTVSDRFTIRNILNK